MKKSMMSGFITERWLVPAWSPSSARGLCMLAAAMAAALCHGGTAKGKDAGCVPTRPVPQQIRLMIASFGTIDSQAEVEGWLQDQLRPTSNMAQSPIVSNAEKIANPELIATSVYVNWNDRRLVYKQEADAVQAENARRARMLLNLKTAALSNPSQRYVALGRDYLQAAIRRQKAGKLITIVDRGNMTIQQTEKQIKGMDADVANGADLILSVVMGDREEDSEVISMDNIGTKLMRTTYTAPYNGKVRDLDGNIQLTFSGQASIRATSDNVVATKSSDPARKLLEKVCEEIAKEVVNHFTVELCFKVKAPQGFDADEATIYVDGREVDGETVRVLAIDHEIRAELEGCHPISKIVNVSDESDTKTVKLFFKK